MADKPKTRTAAILIIGNEILSGRTPDQNFPYLAPALNEIGVILREARTIADDEPSIIAAVNECRAAFDYVFTTGGIGPTHDDITAGCIAKAFGVALVVHPEARRRLEAHYPAGDLNEARLRMARVPEGASLIDNPVSAAPGFRLDNVYVMAGVPGIMRAMFNGIRHSLKGGAVVLSRSISVHLPEGTLATPLAALQERNTDVEIGSYPFFRAGRLGSSIVMRCTDADRLGLVADALKELMRDLDGEPIEDAKP